MSGFANPILGGGGALVYPSIHSPNFIQSPLTGWSIEKNGDVFFASLTIGGEVVTVLIYSGVPASGNLITSIEAAPGADPFGNAIPTGGVVNYTEVGGIFFASSLSNGALQFWSAPSAAGPWTLPAQMGIEGVTGGGLRIETSFLQITGTGFPNSNLAFLPPSGDASGATDTALLALLLNAGFEVHLMTGTYDIDCGNGILTGLGPGQYIHCSGDLATIIRAHGSGDLFRWVHTGSISDGTTTGGGLIGGCTIDGSACTAAAVAVHAGDINALRLDYRAQNFTQTGGSWGLLLDNANFWTERLHLNVRVRKCGFAGGDGGMVGFTVSGALTSTNSFARIRGRIELTQESNQCDGVVFMNGAFPYDILGLSIVGNFTPGAAVTAAGVFRLTGTVPAGHPGAGLPSGIGTGRLDVGVECSAGTNTAKTIIRDSAANQITCYGNMNFNANLTSSGLTDGGFQYDGQVQGDPSLGTRRYYGEAALQTLTGNGQTILSIMPSAVLLVTSTANVTAIILEPGDQPGQVIWIINTGSDSIQFDVPANSNVAEPGAFVTIVGGQAKRFIWEPGTALWYTS